MAQTLNKQLLAAAREAREVFFHLMLAEQAHKVRGTYTEAYERLDKAIRAAEGAIKEAPDDARS
jgi:hypothetical protein